MKIDSEVACGKQHYCMYKYVLHPTFGKLLVSWTRKGREGGVMKGWERAKSKHVTHLDDGLERKESVEQMKETATVAIMCLLYHNVIEIGTVSITFICDLR